MNGIYKFHELPGGAFYRHLPEGNDTQSEDPTVFHKIDTYAVADRGLDFNAIRAGDGVPIKEVWDQRVRVALESISLMPNL